ncbi:MAG: hypothetical protein HYS17_11535 [Micavibrio aeruginosavorus]|uniref:Uncharacterized protein n=1 Tax=Micavibrio aeruginosavorus TaxID=349221 RepID=A0A7T5R246_9BACT|nr:MAG: hypothetical protein HYS17_11535 [Micavibrio aeruginosavorus]
MNSFSAIESRHGERGNVLFLILIAVALFAALSYAVTQSTRSGGGASDNETGLINSAQLTQYPAGVRTAVVRMIIGGTDVNNIEFNPPSNFQASSPSVGVFHPSAGGATYATAPVEIMDPADGNTGGEWVFNAENQINFIGTTDGGGPTAATAEVIAFLPGITQSVCQRINTELGLPANAPTESGLDIASLMDDATPGICDPACAGGTIGGDVTDLDGQPYGCFQHPAGVYVYYHVLVER